MRVDEFVLNDLTHVAFGDLQFDEEAGSSSTFARSAGAESQQLVALHSGC